MSEIEKLSPQEFIRWIKLRIQVCAMQIRRDPDAALAVLDQIHEEIDKRTIGTGGK